MPRRHDESAGSRLGIACEPRAAESSGFTGNVRVRASAAAHRRRSIPERIEEHLWPTSPPRPHSGSRWEPPTTPTDPADSPSPASTPAAQASAGPRRLRGRVAVVGAAVGLLTVGGLGGFAAGQAFFGDSADSGVVQDAVPGDDGDSFRGGPPGGDRPVPPGRTTEDAPTDDGDTT